MIIKGCIIRCVFYSNQGVGEARGGGGGGRRIPNLGYAMMLWKIIVIHIQPVKSVKGHAAAQLPGSPSLPKRQSKNRKYSV